jgi:hypothetical protein
MRSLPALPLTSWLVYDCLEGVLARMTMTSEPGVPRNVWWPPSVLSENVRVAGWPKHRTPAQAGADDHRAPPNMATIATMGSSRFLRFMAFLLEG